MNKQFSDDELKAIMHEFHLEFGKKIMALPGVSRREAKKLDVEAIRTKNLEAIGANTWFNDRGIDGAEFIKQMTAFYSRPGNSALVNAKPCP